MDRIIYKFRYKEMTDVAEVFAELIQSLFSSAEITNMTTDELLDKSIAGISISKSLKGLAKFASVVIPAGLRLTEREQETVPPEATMKYLPKILEVNRGFFYELLQGLVSITEVVPTLLLKEIPTSPTPKEELVRKS